MCRRRRREYGDAVTPGGSRKRASQTGENGIAAPAASRRLSPWTECGMIRRWARWDRFNAADQETKSTCQV